MEFLYPQYLWSLLGIPVALLCWALGVRHQRRMRERFGNMENLEEISRISWAGLGWWRGGLFAASLTALILGLASPQMLARNVRAVPKATDVVFMLDISPSMFAKDMDPHRLGRAEQIVQEFIRQKLPDDRYALVAFNYNSVILSYLTRDPQSILVYFGYLNRTTEPLLGTNMGAALISGLRIIEADERLTPQNVQRRRIFVLISDGDDNIEQWEAPAGQVVRRGIKIHTVGLGTANGAFFPLVLSTRGEAVQYALTESGERLISKAQTRTLRAVADRTGGRFFRGDADGQVQAAVDAILRTERPIAGYQASPERRDLKTYFFAAAFIGMLAGAFL